MPVVLVSLIAILFSGPAHAYLSPGPFTYLLELIAFGTTALISFFFYVKSRMKGRVNGEKTPDTDEESSSKK